MAITEFSKIYHEKMFPGYVSKFLETDPEFIEWFGNFAFDRVEASVFGGGRHTWSLQLTIKVVKTNNCWKIAEAVASTY